jgi:hypothetical protein
MAPTTIAMHTSTIGEKNTGSSLFNATAQPFPG